MTPFLLSLCGTMLVAAPPPEGGLEVERGLVWAPGKLKVTAEAEKEERVYLFGTRSGNSSKLRIPGISGTWRLQAPYFALASTKGKKAITLQVPGKIRGFYLDLQAMVVGKGGARFTAPLRIAIASIDMIRSSAPRKPQLEDQANVGQWMHFTAQLLPAIPGAEFQWTVSGRHVRDYEERMTKLWKIVPMTASAYTRSTFEFYWQPDASQCYPRNGGSLTHSLSLEARVRFATRLFKKKVKRKFRVERNEKSLQLQAEDFYTEYNHLEKAGPGRPHTRLLNHHSNWHTLHDWYLSPRCGWQTRFYKSFLPMHGAMIQRFQDWRKAFGYPPLTEWDPSRPLPKGSDVDHLNRKAKIKRYPLPSYLTVKGGLTKSPCFGYTRLSQFKSIEELSPESAEPWHFGVHWAVGGDMGSIHTSPKDPIFWRFHLFIENRVHQPWLALSRR